MQTEISNTFVPQRYSPSAILDCRRKLLVHPVIQSPQESFSQPVLKEAWGSLEQLVDAIFPDKAIFSGESKLLPENIASSRLTVPESPRMLKGWSEMRVILHLEPNRPGIKLRVGDDWHFSLLLKDMYKTTNEISDRGERGRTIALQLFYVVQFFKAPDDLDNFTNLQQRRNNDTFTGS